MEKKNRLGRGLDALLGDADGNGVATLSSAEVPVEQIQTNPYQPRKTFDDDEILSLGESIKNHGVLQPLVVRQVDGQYQLIAGERRLRAARLVGLSAVPVRVVDFNDQQVLEAALVENIHRADLNPIEKAQGFKEYLDRFEMTHEQLAARLGLARTTITNLLNLLEMSQPIQDAVRTGQITLGHAKTLKGVAPERQATLVKEVVTRGLSVHALDTLIKEQDQAQALADSPLDKLKKDLAEATREPRAAVEKTAHVRGIETELQLKMATKVEVKLKDEHRGQVVIAFENNDDFERILEVLRR